MPTTNGVPEEARIFGVAEPVRISIRKRTFLQRLRSMALWFGIPAVCVELIGVPKNLWLYGLIFLIPAAAVGVLTGAVILHVAAARQSKASDGGESSI